MPAPTTIAEAHWTLILKRIRERQCVPFLGAGVNARRQGYPGLPGGAEVALRLMEDLTGRKVQTLDELVKVESDDSLAELHDLVRVGLQDLARVSLHVRHQLDQPHLMDRLREVISDEQNEPPRLLHELARLDVRLIVTSNYDRLMERALAAAGKAFLPVHQPTGGYDHAGQVKLQNQITDWGPGLILYKIHGTFLDTGPGNGGDGEAIDPMRWRPIITEDDYIEFLTVAAIEDRGVPRMISSEMVGSTLLFLGYSLEDWDFRTIFKGLIEVLPTHHQRKSFALQKDPPEFWFRFWQGKGVEIYNVDLHDFAEELAKRVQADG